MDTFFIASAYGTKVDVTTVRQLLPLDDYDIYLCGPPPFIQAMFTGLLELGVRKERIRYGSFGPAAGLERPDALEATSIDTAPKPEPVTVRFAQSDVEATWMPEFGTLEEL
ncbi:MAG: hypothetical protein ACR2PG_23495 [Hyphomicrobiaceae bacterium]